MSTPKPETTWDGLPIAADPPYGASVVVYRRAAAGLEVLLLHRAHQGPDYAGDWAWTPPAGARMPGEQIEACAARELYEEAGLELEIQPFVTEADWAAYTAEAASDASVTLHDPEHDRYEWVSPEEAQRRVRPSAPLDTLRAALDRLT